MTEDINSRNLKSTGAGLLNYRLPRVTNVFLNVIIIVFSVIIAGELLFNCFFSGIYVVNISMQPTFNGAISENRPGGDFIYVNKWAQPEYGDVVVVYAEVSGSSGIISRGNLIKRVLAFGGDTVEIIEGVLYRNGEAVDESGYLDSDRNSPYLNNFPEHKVKEGCMFLLGDNRNKSSDSREYGDFPVSSLVGVVPQWSIDNKEFTTAVYTYFNFTLLGKN